MTRKKFYVVLDIITNVLVVPVLLVALACSILMFSAKKHNAVPSLFGYSAVKILTGSMQTDEHPEFAINQTVLVKKVNPESLQVGDVIAFYEYVHPGDSDLEYEDVNGGTIVKPNADLSFSQFVGGDTNEAAESGSRVLFHRIVEIKIASTTDGQVHYFFSTKGDVNGSPDSFVDKDKQVTTAYIRDDFVVGVYMESSQFITGFFSFCASSTGIVTLVIVPASLVLLMVSTSIIEQINQLVAQKKSERKKILEAEKMLQGEAGAVGPDANPEQIAKSEEAAKPQTNAAPKPEAKPVEKTNVVPPKAPTTASKAAASQATSAQAAPSAPPKAPAARPAAPKASVPPKAPAAKQTVPPKAPAAKPAAPPKASVPPKAPPAKPN